MGEELTVVICTRFRRDMRKWGCPLDLVRLTDGEVKPSSLPLVGALPLVYPSLNQLKGKVRSQVNLRAFNESRRKYIGVDASVSGLAVLAYGCSRHRHWQRYTTKGAVNNHGHTCKTVSKKDVCGYELTSRNTFA